MGIPSSVYHFWHCIHQDNFLGNSYHLDLHTSIYKIAQAILVQLQMTTLHLVQQSFLKMHYQWKRTNVPFQDYIISFTGFHFCYHLRYYTCSYSFNCSYWNVPASKRRHHRPLKKKKSTYVCVSGLNSVPPYSSISYRRLLAPI